MNPKKILEELPRAENEHDDLGSTGLPRGLSMHAHRAIETRSYKAQQEGIEAQRLLDAQYIADNYVRLPQVSDIINWIHTERPLNVEAFARELHCWLKDKG